MGCGQSGASRSGLVRRPSGHPFSFFKNSFLNFATFGLTT
jgi:hypothetical protein